MYFLMVKQFYLIKMHGEFQYQQYQSIKFYNRRGKNGVINILNKKLKNPEREGFEPPVPCRTSDFESDTIGHSDTSPFF